jgi:O-succinylbenzoate synthase
VGEDGRTGWGEVAPIPWFGTETLEEAIAFLQQMPPLLTDLEIASIPDTLPTCQFGLGSAHQAITGADVQLGDDIPLQFSALLPAGEAALKTWPALWERGYRTLKWKIAVQSADAEMKIFQQLAAVLPEGTKLRLDANGGLTLQEAIVWLNLLPMTQRIQVEYLEQPLPTAEFQPMLQLSRTFSTPLALDESVTTLMQLEQCHRQGWQGVMVIKPAIAGYPQRLAHLLSTCQMDTVFSSVFETETGRAMALSLARCFSHSQRAIGFSLDPWFAGVTEMAQH